MCGINGVVFLKRDRSPQELALVKFLFGEAFRNTLPRGKDATGVALFDRDGDWVVKKSPVTVEKFTDSEDWTELLDLINDNTGIALGHVRAYTQGSPSDNNNNHPIIVEKTIGVHNGGVQNDYTLMKDFKFEKIGSVDSEVIFHLINKYNENAITYSGLKEALEDSKLRMVGTFCFVNVNEPTKLWIVKQQERPMTITYWHELGVIMFNSIAEYVTNAIDSLNRFSKTVSFVGVNFSTATVEIADNQVFALDANGTTLEDCITNPKRIAIDKSYSYATTTSARNSTVTNTTTSTTTGTGTGTGTGTNTNTGLAVVDTEKKSDDSTENSSPETLTPNNDGDITNLVGLNKGYTCDDCQAKTVEECYGCNGYLDYGSHESNLVAVTCSVCGEELDSVELEYAYNLDPNNSGNELCLECGKGEVLRCELDMNVI